MTATGRILNEPHEVYHGEHDKPAFGSGAVKLWITDPDLFYHRYIAKDVAMQDDAEALDEGSAFDDWFLLHKRDYIVSKFRTRAAAGFRADKLKNPGKVVLTPASAGRVEKLHLDATDDETLSALVAAGEKQVTYRIDRGCMYLQARVDLEVDHREIPERALEPLQIVDVLKIDRCLIDLKSCQSHYGQYAFRRQAVKSPLQYPIQAALYQLIIEEVTGLSEDQLPFRFAAVAKDGTGVKFYNIFDYQNEARNKVKSAIVELEYRVGSNDWADFETNSVTVLVPDNYLAWAGV